MKFLIIVIKIYANLVDLDSIETSFLKLESVNQLDAKEGSGARSVLHQTQIIPLHHSRQVQVSTKMFIFNFAPLQNQGHTTRLVSII